MESSLSFSKAAVKSINPEAVPWNPVSPYPVDLSLDSCRVSSDYRPMQVRVNGIRLVRVNTPPPVCPGVYTMQKYLGVTFFFI